MKFVGDKVPVKDIRKLLEEAIRSEEFAKQTQLTAGDLDRQCGEHMTLQAMIVTWAEASIKEMRAKKTREENDRNIANLEQHLLRKSKRKRPEVNMNEGALRRKAEEANNA